MPLYSCTCTCTVNLQDLKIIHESNDCEDVEKSMKVILFSRFKSMVATQRSIVDNCVCACVRVKGDVDG
jgi:hypothetical protein